MLYVRFSILILTCYKASTKKAPLISTNRDIAKKSSRSIITTFGAVTWIRNSKCRFLLFCRVLSIRLTRNSKLFEKNNIFGDSDRDRLKCR